MALLSLLLIISAVDIHSHGVVVPCTVLPDENPTIISFSSVTFDTRNGEPMLPEDLRVTEYDGNGYYLVQVKGPVYQEYLNELKDIGIKVIGYIPMYALIVYANQEAIAFANIKSFVQWTGIYQPAYKLHEALLNAKGTDRVTIQLFPIENPNEIAKQIQAKGFDVVLVVDHEIAKTIDVIGDLGRISAVARITGVQWIQPWSQATVFNNNCQWVTQTGWRSAVPVDSIGRRVWHKGVRGRGTVLSTSDTGITTAHWQFYDAAYPITGPGAFPSHRKVVGYKVYSGAAFGDVGATWHGSHVNCTVAGDDSINGGTSAYDGLAKDAKIYFADIANATGGLVVSTNLTPLYDTVYLGRGLTYRILQHSGSWGWTSGTGDYLTQDATTDAYIYRYPVFLNLYAAANSGPTYRTIAHPGLSKNILTIGATGNGTSSNTIASWSSRGPTQDSRIKPTICAPGVSLMSADGATSGSGSAYKAMSGTSMATPSANGAVGLIRHYLLAGYYPTGSARPSDSIKYQSAALLKSMAIVSADPNVGTYVVPDSNIGWGRIDVDSVLFFTGDLRKLIIKDDTIGVGTGQSITDSFLVNSSIPLRICVVWTDTAAASGANPSIVNNLNTTLTAPSGTYYRGSQYTSGQSTANPTTWDTRNVEECFRVNSPGTGKWKLMVTGQSVPNAPMGYAFAISGDVSPIVVGVEEGNVTIPVTENISFSSITTGRIVFNITLPTEANVQARIYDLTGRVVEEIINVKLPAGENRYEHNSNLTSGVYFLEVKTDNITKIDKLLIVR